MERKVRPEIPSPSSGANERVRERREAVARPGSMPQSALQVAVSVGAPKMLMPEGASSTKNCRESTLRREISKLKRLLADKTVEVDFFRSALQKVEARRQQNDISGEKASTTKSEMPLQGNLSIERMCQLAQVSRAGFYRYLQSHAPAEEDMTVRSDYSGDRPGTSATLRLSAGHGGTATTRHDGESQTRVTNDAGGQPVDSPNS